MNWFDIIKISPHEQQTAMNVIREEEFYMLKEEVESDYEHRITWIESYSNPLGVYVIGTIEHSGFWIKIVKIFKETLDKTVFVEPQRIPRIMMNMDELKKLGFEAIKLHKMEMEDDDIISVPLSWRHFHKQIDMDDTIEFNMGDWPRRKIEYFIGYIKKINNLATKIGNHIVSLEWPWNTRDITNTIDTFEYYFPEFLSQRTFEYSGEPIGQMVKHFKQQKAADKRAKGLADSNIDSLPNVTRMNETDMKKIFDDVSEEWNHVDNYRKLGYNDWIKIVGNTSRTYFINISKPASVSDNRECSIAMFDTNHYWYCTGTDRTNPIPWGDYILSVIMITAVADDSDEFKKHVIRQG